MYSYYVLCTLYVEEKGATSGSTPLVKTDLGYFHYDAKRQLVPILKMVTYSVVFIHAYYCTVSFHSAGGKLTTF
jgi:hypothetical protein